MSLFASVVANVGLQDGLDWSDVVAFCSGATTVVVFVVLVFRPLVRPAYREYREFMAWWKKFERDWDGEPAAEGRDAVPGVMARLNKIDGEMSRNGGESMKDKIVKTWELVGGLDQRVSDIEARQCEIQRTQLEMAERIKDTNP